MNGKIIFLTALLLFSIFWLFSLPAQTQPEMNEMARKNFEVSAKQLDDTYNKLLKLLDDKGKAKLAESQKAWLAYRDAEAAFEADDIARDGTMASSISYACKEGLTQSRIKELQTEIDLPGR